MTPCEKAGLKVGDKIRIMSAPSHSKYSQGLILTLTGDDGSAAPEFACPHHIDSDRWTYFSIDDKDRLWEKVMKPTNKQEALDQIDSLRAYIEDCDKPKRVRVYVKESAMDHPYITAGRLYDLERVDRDGYYWISGPAISGDVDTACCDPKDCIIVEGELPPNE